MSGGVDSTTCAMLLKEEGFDVFGLFMNLGQEDFAAQFEHVRDLGARIGVEVVAVDLAKRFRREVKDFFRDSYLRGRTPNPCVVCNRKIKFGALMEEARALGARRLATGHYVRLDRKEGRLRLRKGMDPAKDQSYFLCRLDRDTLAACLFPLGGYRKEEVYRLAAARGLEFSPAGESQDVCFLAGRSLGGYFSAEGVAAEPGEIVDRQGRVLGRHRGIHLYTIGQRRGLGIPAAHPLYVLELDAAANRVIVGPERELWSSGCRTGPVNWIAPPDPDELAAEVKIRYRHRPVRCRIRWNEVGAEIVFAEPQRAVTPGQFAAFYQGDELVGGAEIQGPGDGIG